MNPKNHEKYFDEKSHQVDCGAIVAFGISVNSRYEKASEIIELINFAMMAVLLGVDNYIKEVFYDSKAYLCTIELEPCVQQYDIVSAEIFKAANKTISQFDWFGTVYHGDPMPDTDE